MFRLSVQQKRLCLFKLILDYKDKRLSSYFKGFASDLLMEKLVLIIEITENKKLFSITNRFSLPVPKNGSQNAQFDYLSLQFLRFRVTAA